MATGGVDGSSALILKDFEHWLETTPDAQIFLLQVLLNIILFISFIQGYEDSPVFRCFFFCFGWLTVSELLLFVFLTVFCRTVWVNATSALSAPYIYCQASGGVQRL